MFSAIDPSAGPMLPLLQRSRDYSRQRTMTLGDLLLENRIVFVGSSPETGGSPVISDYLANITIQKLLYLQYENKTADIHMYINSPGGSVSATLAMYDTMQFLESPIITYCMGIAASGAAILLAAGTAGKRYALPHSRVLMHQPSAGVQGQASDIAIQAEYLIKTKREMAELIAQHSGQDVEQIIRDSDRDRWFSATEAKEYGLLDHVISRAGELSASSSS